MWMNATAVSVQFASILGCVPHGVFTCRRHEKESAMKVWVDQDLCTGDALCTDICPELFVMVDGLSYVRSGSEVLTIPGGAQSLAAIPDRLLEAVVEAAEECPGECIFIES
jgi:ferredoxin